MFIIKGIYLLAEVVASRLADVVPLLGAEVACAEAPPCVFGLLCDVGGWSAPRGDEDLRLLSLPSSNEDDTELVASTVGRC